VGFIWMRRFDKIYFCMIPTIKDFLYAFLAVIFIGAISLPIGYLIDVVQFPHSLKFSFLSISSFFLNHFFTISIFEEIIFRGVLYTGFVTYSKKKIASILMSSFFFGLTYWIK
jgi:membrane protease YdiL (CAAX protease family)